MRHSGRISVALRECRILLGSGLLIQCGFTIYLLIGDSSNPLAPLLVSLAPVAVGYGVALWHVLRRRPTGSTPASGSALAVILLWATLFRFTLLATDPHLSDDIHRYIWDGRVQVVAGVNPYSFAPSSPELAHLRDDLCAAINHKDIPTIYPPFAQLFFAVVGAIAPTVLVMKLCLTICEVALIFVIISLLRRRGQDSRRAVLYAWHPLAVIEVAGNGHVDALGVLLLLLALLWLATGHRYAMAVALSLAFLSKLLPLLAAPVIWRELGSQRSRLTRWLHPGGRLPFLVFLGVSAGGYAAYSSAGARIVEGLATYLRKWRFNDSLFGIILDTIETSSGSSGETTLIAARWVSLALLAAFAVWSTVRIADPLRAVFLIVAAYLLLSPTVHPWYLLWLLPFLPFFPRPPWLLFSWSAFLAYEVLDRYRSAGVWAEEPWVRWVEYGPLYLLLLLSALNSVRNRRQVVRNAETGASGEASQEVSEHR